VNRTTDDATTTSADALHAAGDPHEHHPHPIEPQPADIVAAARRRHGAAGAMLAAGMVAINDVLLGQKPKEEAPIVVASPTEPHDVDRDGITVPVDAATSVFAPPQPPTDPYAAPAGRRR
jgi:hypothetical protein